MERHCRRAEKGTSEEPVARNTQKIEFLPTFYGKSLDDFPINVLFYHRSNCEM